MKVRAVERELTQNGWTLARQAGSHRQYRNPDNTNVVTVSGKPGDEMTPGQLALTSAERQD
ncbi:MAG TPA: type II toxin-antitoxin system HicA family toxin [Candidatus Saccharimonadales bacterium]|nr:type II toxin-antitoxin system HicA family toxin [Candidatus Saccharimonadales bacterium]